MIVEIRPLFFHSFRSMFKLLFIDFARQSGSKFQQTIENSNDA